MLGIWKDTVQDLKDEEMYRMEGRYWKEGKPAGEYRRKEYGEKNVFGGKNCWKNSLC